MLAVKPNSRQMPKDTMYTASSKYSDLLYAYLQELSQVDIDGSRIVFAHEVTFTKLAERLGISRQTASKRFKNLQELGLVSQKSFADVYKLYVLDREVAALIPLDVIETLVDTLSENCISVYVYLLNRWVAAGYMEYEFTLGHLKAFIGISENTRSNDKIINNIMFILERLELVKFRQETEMTAEGYKTKYRVTWATNQL